MAIKFEKIEVGMTLYDRRKHNMGNTTLKTIGEWEVKIVSIDKEHRTAKASWNGNPPTFYSQRDLTKLHTWSMYDPDVEVTKNMLGGVSKVKKIRKPKGA